MTRGYKPVVAIGEAQRKATAWGFLLIGLVTEAKLPFDFVIHDTGHICLVRVRRLKYSLYGISDILKLCGHEIKELRELQTPNGIFRELWVRGPDRTWHRYLVLPGSVEVLEEGDETDDNNRKEGGAVPPASFFCRIHRNMSGITLQAFAE